VPRQITTASGSIATAHGPIAAAPGWIATVRRVTLLGTVIAATLAVDPTGSGWSSQLKVAVLVAAALVLSCLAVIDRIFGGHAPAGTPLRWPVLAGLGWFAVTTATSTDPTASLLGGEGSHVGLLTVAALAAVYFAAARVAPAELVRLLTVLVLAAGLVVGYGLLQLHDLVSTWGGRWDPVPWALSRAKPTVFATMGNANHLAGLLAMVLPLGLALLATVRHRPVRIPIAAVLAGCVALLVATTARGAWLAAAVAVTLFVVLLRSELRRWLGWALGGIAATALTVAALLAGTAATKYPLADVAAGAGAQATASLRLQLWEAALRISADHPLLGVGPEAFGDVFPEYQTPEFIWSFGANRFANGPHNLMLDVVVGQGVAGLILLGWLLVVAAVLAARSWRALPAEPREPLLLLAGIVAALVAYLVQASFNTAYPALGLWFVLLLGLLTAASHRRPA
jgi:O-antigen ligase